MATMVGKMISTGWQNGNYAVKMAPVVEKHQTIIFVGKVALCKNVKMLFKMNPRRQFSSLCKHSMSYSLEFDHIRILGVTLIILLYTFQLCLARDAVRWFY